MTEPLPDLNIKIKYDGSEVDAGVDKTEAKVAGLGAAGKKAGDETAAGFDKAGRASADYDRLVHRHLDDQSTGYQTVQRQIDATRTKINQLKGDFAKTGSKSIFGDLKGAQSDLKKLTGYAEDMIPAFSDAGKKSGSGFLSNLAGSLGDFSSTGIAIKLGIVAAVIAAAPIAASLLSGAIAAGIGLGGVAVGIASAVRDPRVKAELNGLKGEISSVFTLVGQPFILPLIGAVSDFRADLSTLSPEIRRALAPLATTLQPLEKGLVGLLRNTLPGMSHAFANIAPDVSFLASLLPEIGTSIGKFFDLVTRNGPAVRTGIEGIVNAFTGLLNIFGHLLAWGGSAFMSIESGLRDVIYAASDAVAAFGLLPGVGGKAQDLAAKLRGVGDVVSENISKAKDFKAPTDDLTDSWRALANQQAHAAKTLEQLMGDYDTWRGKITGVRDANLAVHQSLSELQDALSRGKVSWNINTQAGQEMLAKLYAVDDANNRYFLSLHSTTPQTVADYLKQEQSLYKMAKAAGAPASALAEISDEIKKLKDQLNSLNGKKVKFYIDETHTVVRHVVSPSTYYGGLAQGGIVGYGRSLDYAGLREHAQGGVGAQEFAQSGVYSGGPTRSLIKFAEPSTRGEAYIARNGNLGGQVSALSTAIGWLSERGAFRGSMAGSTLNIGQSGPLPDVVINTVTFLDNAVVARSQTRANLREVMRSGTSGQS